MQMTRRTGMIGTLAVLMTAAAPIFASEKKELSGTVAYRERMALPPGAIVDVKLLDVSLADAPAIVLAEVSITPAGQVPVPYTLTYDPAAIQAGHRYALQARIILDEKLLFTTDSHWAVFDGGENKTDLLLKLVNSDVRTDTDGLQGTWLAEDIGGGGVMDYLQTTLQIRPDGSFSGSGGCNNYRGNAQINGNAIRFGPAAATFKACTPAAMDQELKFHTALGEVRSWEIDAIRRKLILKGQAGETLVVLDRQ